MAFVYKDNVRETTVSTGTGTLTLGGASGNSLTFAAAIGVGNSCCYRIGADGAAEWEVGIGTVGSGTLTRTTVLSSSNAGALVSFSAGSKVVFVTFPAFAAAPYVGTTAPTPALDGHLWFDSTYGTLKIYYDSFWIDVTSSAAGTLVVQNNVRLYAVTGTPVPTTDTTTVSTIYVGPFNGNLLTVLNSSDQLLTFTLSEISLALSGLTSGKAYDVFVYHNGSTFVIELSAAWASDTSRTDAVVLVNGLYVKSSDHTRLHVGTIYTTGTTSTADTAAKRYVWNRYNQRLAFMKNATETADSWTYAVVATWRQANANTANQLDYVTGDAGAVVDASLTANTSGATNDGAVGIGVDSTTAFSGYPHYFSPSSGVAGSVTARYSGRPGSGRHYLAWLEYRNSGTVTFYGDGAAPTFIQCGLLGTLWN